MSNIVDELLNISDSSEFESTVLNYEPISISILHDIINSNYPYETIKPLIASVLEVKNTLFYHDIDVDVLKKNWEKDTPLALACKLAQWDTASGLINDFNAKVDYGYWWYTYTPLFYAVSVTNPNVGQSVKSYDEEHIEWHKKHQELIRLMLKKGANPDASTRDSLVILTEACKKDFFVVANILVNEGNANVKKADKDSITALHATMGWGSRRVWECTTEMQNLIDSLVNKGADMNTKDKNDLTPMVYAVRWGRYDAAEYLIQKYNFDLSAADSRGNNALIFAANNTWWWQDGQLLKMLATKTTPKPFLVNKDGDTPLSYCLNKRNTPGCWLLMQKMGGVRLQVDYQRALNEEVGWSMPTTAIAIAICAGDIEKVKEAMKIEGTKKSEMDLFMERQYEKVESYIADPWISYMEEKGFTVDEFRRIHNTVPFVTTRLHLAVQYDQLDIVKLLLEEYDDMKDIDALDYEGNTPLIMACKLNRTKVGIYLIYKGADPEKKDPEEKIALHYAVRNNLVDLSFEIIKKTANLKPIIDEGFTKINCCDALCKKYVEWMVSNLKPQNELYTDPQFPASLKSIFKNPNIDLEKNKPEFDVPEKWIRFREIPTLTDKPALFLDGLRVDDIEEGGIGTCFFLGSLGVLTTQPELVQDLFVSYDLDVGIYGIRYNQNGKWCFVIIDDFVPCGGPKGLPLYAWSKDRREMYVMLLEKAYAKVKGVYEEIDGGIARYSVIDLTGGVCKQLKFYKGEGLEAIKNKTLWKTLYTAYNVDRSLMSCQIENPDAESEHKREDGILENHAYGLLEVIKTYGHRLLKINNPHGYGKWLGAWADNSKEWEQNPLVKKQVNPEFINNGVFYMCFEDFINVFNAVDITTIVRQIRSLDSVHLTQFPNINLLSHFLHSRPQEAFFIQLKTSPVRLTIEFSQEGVNGDEFSGREILLIVFQWPLSEVEKTTIELDHKNVDVGLVRGDWRTANIVGRILPTFDTRVSLSLNLWDTEKPYIVFPMLRNPEDEKSDVIANERSKFPNSDVSDQDFIKNISLNVGAFCNINFYSDTDQIEYRKAVFSTELAQTEDKEEDNMEQKSEADGEKTAPKEKVKARSEMARVKGRSEVARVKGRSEVARVKGRSEVARVKGRSEVARVKSKGKTRGLDDDNQNSSPSLPTQPQTTTTKITTTAQTNKVPQQTQETADSTQQAKNEDTSIDDSVTSETNETNEPNEPNESDESADDENSSETQNSDSARPLTGLLPASPGYLPPSKDVNLVQNTPTSNIASLDQTNSSGSLDQNSSITNLENIEFPISNRAELERLFNFWLKQQNIIQNTPPKPSGASNQSNLKKAPAKSPISAQKLPPLKGAPAKRQSTTTTTTTPTTTTVAPKLSPYQSKPLPTKWKM